MTVGMPVAPIFEVKNPVSSGGKFATALSPMTTSASPRNSASVPIVTASDGSPTTATRKPLNMPASTPITSPRTSTTPMSHPACQSTPMSALVRPAIDATDRSISPVMMMRVIGIAMSSTGITSSSRKPTVTGDAKRGMEIIAMMIVAMSR